MVLSRYTFLTLILSAIIQAAISPDATCGLKNNAAGNTCKGSSFGNCCSKNGWCGSTSAYCSTGCQSGYGTCSTVTPTGFSACIASKNVPVNYAASATYNQLAKPYNLRLPYSPAAIVIPTNQQQVSDAVICAAKNNLKVQARSGGHSYASYSTGGKDGSIVIDLQSFQGISVDAHGIAKVGGGVRLGNLALGLYNQARRAISHGTCPGVGIGGHASHGGYGYSARNWGLALDAIFGLDVVLADGTAVYTSSTAHPDLFYALRGAADSFGIITTFHLKTQAAPDSIINWQFPFPGVLETPAIATKIMLHLQDWAQNSSVVDRKLGGMGVYMDGDGTFSMSGTYFGDLATFNSKIKPELLRTLPTPGTPDIRVNNWLSSLQQLAGSDPLSEPKSGYDKHDDFFAKSLVVPQSSPFTSTGLTSYFNYISQNLNNGMAWFSIINLYGGADSQVNAVPASSAAYADRSSLWVIQHYGWTTNADAPFPSNIQPFITGLSNSLTSAQTQTKFTAYLNYLDPSLSPAQAHDLYYGPAVYNKLLTLKRQLDPASVFWNPQAIGTT